MSTPSAPIPGVTPPPSATGEAAVSARDFFMQDDNALAVALNVDMSEPEELIQPQIAPSVSDDDEGSAADEVIAGATPPAPKPTDEVIIPSVAADKKLMTEFAVMDDAGELEIPDIKIRFKAKGESRELPLDHVVRLAQFGFANEEREQQVMAARKFVSEAEQKEQQYIQRVQQYEGYYERLFNDPAFYEDARIAFLNQNAPEARAERAETELRTVRQQQAQQREMNTVNTFVQQQLVPTVQKLLTENPMVNEYEVIGRYNELAAPLLVNGRVPIERLPYVQKLVSDDLANWVQRVHFERSLEKQKQTQAVGAATARATADAAQAKRQASRVFAHQGAPSADGTPAKPVKYDTARSWLDSTFGSND